MAIDIGDAIRCAGKRLQTEALSHPPAPAVSVEVQREVDSLLSIWQSHFDSGVRPDEEDEPEGAALWDRIASARRAMLATRPQLAAVPADTIKLAEARGFNGAMRYVLGYLNGAGDMGSTAYTELLNACDREAIIHSAIEDEELEFTGLGRFIELYGTDTERAMIRLPARERAQKRCDELNANQQAKPAGEVQP